ncbi:MAG: NfeD family protein [Deltaproteobacteria bacterium]|nr:MAG: NfeD family protein [Deltaproteobacteria bacterium]
MNDLALNIWLVFGAVCIISELLLPGLVMVFVGLGALTVALGLYLGHIVGLPAQFITFFISSIIYVFTLRLLVLRFVPTDTVKENIDEDEQIIGQIVTVCEAIPPGGNGRIMHGDSTWQAKSSHTDEILKGEQVKIVGRENITLIVEKI